MNKLFQFSLLYILASTPLFGRVESLAEPDYKPVLIELIDEPDPVFDGPDLETMIQDFVLETKKINIPGFPDAFNPSIVRWEDRLLMSFRTYHPKTRSTHEIAIVELNEQFEPIAEAKFLKFRTRDPFCLSKRQDPRLVIVDRRLHIVYNNAIHGEVRRMVVSPIEFEGEDLVVTPECIIHFDGIREARSEKNWVPFDYDGRLHFGYSIVPHRILTHRTGLSCCETVCSTWPPLQWDWGVLRGGTSALLQGEEYLAFFHSSKKIATQHSEGGVIPHYFMGAYMFSSRPPFHVTRISPEPIVGENFYKGRAYKTWRPLRVVFPGGFIADDEFIWVLYGRQDHEIWVAKMDKKGLFDSLIPISDP